MSYFPCDIPYMSKEELKENGIKIPKDKKQEQPEIIRCKDCRWNRDCRWKDMCFCEFFNRHMKPTGYCSWAERKTDG